MSDPTLKGYNFIPDQPDEPSPFTPRYFVCLHSFKRNGGIRESGPQPVYQSRFDADFKQVLVVGCRDCLIRHIDQELGETQDADHRHTQQLSIQS